MKEKSNTILNSITVNGKEYVLKDFVDNNLKMADTYDSMEYCMVRTYSAGVFAGYLESLEGEKAIVRNARRIWYWAGAASLSQLAVDGTSAPEKCKFPCAVDKVILTNVIEIIPMTEKAKKSIDEVAIWEM